MSDPRVILEQIPEIRGRHYLVTPLSGGMTNRNYRVDVAQADPGPETAPAIYVLRIAGPNTDRLGIDRHVEAACTRAAAAAVIGPDIVAFLPEHGALLRRFIHGTTLTPEDIRRPETLERLVTHLRRYHDGRPGAGRFCVFATVRSYHAQARDLGVVFPESMSRALAEMDRMEADLATDDPPCPCHNDLLAANLIESPGGLRIIDWEYAGMGDRFFDLANLAVNNEFTAADDLRLLQLYFGSAQDRHRHRLRCLRRLSDLREALWGFLQSGISRLDVDFLAYGTKHLDRFHVAR